MTWEQSFWKPKVRWFSYLSFSKEKSCESVLKTAEFEVMVSTTIPSGERPSCDGSIHTCFECGGLASHWKIHLTRGIADAFTNRYNYISAWATALSKIRSDKLLGTAPGTDIKIIRRRFRVVMAHTLSKLKAIARGGDSEQLGETPSITSRGRDSTCIMMALYKSSSS
ncbi:hypothetical protein NC651_015048 [Populus alba x Populus x berolinensis]|nr:hypothetical protein NC651_015048 [Populus alba x Populus x berolinensis]